MMATVAAEDSIETSMHSSQSSSDSEMDDMLHLLEGKLYDRSYQKQNLIDAFHRHISSESSLKELVLITGHSGTGKTYLANKIRPYIEENSKGFFISGKFDQLKRPEPYAIFIQAFTELADCIVKSGRVEEIKKAIAATTSCTRLLTDMIPALEQILGAQSQTPEVKGAGAYDQVIYVFCQFVKAISSPEYPVVLFLDDVQWADPTSLALLSALVTDNTVCGFMVVAACRSNEVSLDDPLSMALRDLESKGVSITNIPVSNLHREAVNQMVSDILGLPLSTATPLADFVFQQTDGNTFFILQVIRALYEEGHLYYEGGCWKWEEIKDFSNLFLECQRDVLQLVTYKIRQLPVAVQEVLKVAACIGAEFEEYLLHEVLTCDVAKALSSAQKKGLVVRSCYSVWRFQHDRIQQSAYSLIADEEQAGVHLQIGRQLWASLSPDDLYLNIFLVVNQLSIGIDLIEDQVEKYQVAALSLRAGEKATLSSEFCAASAYLDLAIGLLGPSHWSDQYLLSLNLFNAAAEVAYCNANFSRAEDLIFQVLEHARCSHDKIRAHTTHIYALGSQRTKLQDAIDKGFRVLKDIGEPFPRKGRTSTIIMELVKTNRMLRHKTAEDILSLPLMLDDTKSAARRIMNILFAFAIHGRVQLAPLIAMRLVQTTLRHGISGMSCVGFAVWGMLLCNAFGDVDQGYRCSNIALQIVDRFKAKEWLTRVYTVTYGLSFPWKVPLRDCLDPLLFAHKNGLETGDIEYATTAGCLYAAVYYHAGLSLDKGLGRIRSFHKMILAQHLSTASAFITPHLQLMLNLMGKCDDPLVLTGEAQDEEQLMKDARAANDTTTIASVLLLKLVVCFYFNDYVNAGVASKALSRADTKVFGSFSRAAHLLFEGMASLAMPKRKTRLAKRNLKRLKVFAKLCAANNLNKVYLLEAEIAAARGKIALALEKYEDSASYAKAEGILSDIPLAFERAGIMLNAHGLHEKGRKYFKKAMVAYQEWGAHAKVSQLRRKLCSETAMSEETDSVLDYATKDRQLLSEKITT